ncbi:MAG: exodeoxyribonuclease VII small subunit [Phycisphaerae bacterium]|jgi:exodeoxyribonuclease VII small subunit
MARQEPEIQMSFEEGRAELEAITSAIEQGKYGLEEMIAQAERARRILDHLKRILSEAEARIQRLNVAEDGTVSTVPMENVE